MRKESVAAGWEKGSMCSGFIKGGKFLEKCFQAVNCVPVKDESVKMFPVWL